MTRPLTTNNHRFARKCSNTCFVADVLRYLWQHGITDAEILTAEVDNAGYDVVIDCNGVIRHIQLKSSHDGSTTAEQKVNLRLASKPSGCVIWLIFDANTRLPQIPLVRGAPGSPLPDISQFRTAKHSKANAQGHKAERPNIRVVGKGKFNVLSTIADVVDRLFAIGNNQHCDAIGRRKTYATEQNGEPERDSRCVRFAHQRQLPARLPSSFHQIVGSSLMVDVCGCRPD